MPSASTPGFRASAPQPRQQASRRRAATRRAGHALAQQRESLVDIARRSFESRTIGLDLPFPSQFGLAARAFGDMRFDAGAFLAIETRADVPRQQRLHLLMHVGAELDNPPAHSQSSIWPASKAFSLRRAWNMRVFTVSTGQPTISLISRQPMPWK